jgi:glutaconate CoA-transferase subunit B
MARGQPHPFTKAELLAVLGSRLLQDGKAVFAGVGIPLLASALAQQTHAPHLTIVVEGGVIRPEILPGRLPISTNEMRAGRRAVMLPGITDTFLFAQRGFFDYGFLGGAQIDRHGNINTSVIGPYDHPKVRLPGSGGAADIIALCAEVLILTLHEKRRFVERVDFVTSPAFLTGGEARREAGLLFGRVSRVVTDLADMGFDPATKLMRVEALHPGVTLDDVRRNTGFDLAAVDPLATTDPPTETELTILRQLDPDRRFLG